MSMSTRWGVLLGCAALGLIGVAAVWSQDPLPSSDVKALIKHDADNLHTALKKATKNNEKRAKTAAVLIAAYAQENLKGKDGQQMATIRNRAVAILEAVNKGDFGEAKNLAANLADLPADAAAKTEPVDLAKLITLDGVMKVYASDRFGGFNFEKSLEELADFKGAVSAEDMDKIVVQANKHAGIVQLAVSFPPEKDDGKKTKAAWLDFCKETRGASADLAKAGRSKDGDMVAKAAQKLIASCQRCHEVFRQTAP